jgi:two-component system, chemotaxis family, chemotaxis protein CheY
MSKSHNKLEERQPVVLVVDDNPAIRDMVSWALELAGYQPAQAADGREALSWMADAARAGLYPDVILLDLAMPGMDGQTFLERLHVQWDILRARPAIIVITAGIAGPAADTLNVDHVIVKPFHVRDLLDVVRRLTATSLA